MKGEDVYLVEYRRTAFSRSRPNNPERDLFNSIRMDQALGELISEAIQTTGVKPEDLGDVIVGGAYQRDENWTYGGRHPVFLSELPYSVPSMAVDRACASSMNAIYIGASEIGTGLSEIVLAGGMEHMTHVPRLSNKLCTPLLEDSRYLEYRMKESYNMGITAENLAAQSGISREEMDQYSLESHQRASKATEKGFIKGEIQPIVLETGGEEVVVDKDQSIRSDTSMEKLAGLPSAFRDGGLVTAGNSSPLNAGASLVMLASGRKVEEYGLEPLAKIETFGWAGVPPYLMGLGPIPASQKALKNGGLTRDDIDVWEINEAFAVVVINMMKEFGLDVSKVNINGGAIAIGHPLGATGARLVGTAARILKEKGKDRAIATLCIGGGQGFATLLERV